MFKFIKNMFKKQDIEPIVFEFGLDELSSHVGSRSKNIIQSINENIIPMFADIKNILDNLSQQTDALEDAEIKNPEKVEERIKLIVEGNRENYIKSLRRLIKELSIQEDKEIDYKKAVCFCENAFKSLDELGKNTQKNFYASQHLFADYVEAIAKTLKELDIAVKRIASFIEEKRILKIELLDESLNNFRKSLQKKTDILQQTDAEKKRLEQIEESKNDAKNRLEDLELSDYSMEIKDLNSNLESLKIESEALKSNVLNLFSPISSALKKYSKLSLENNKLIDSYSEDSFAALLSDKEFKIITILISLKKSINNEALELREEKKEKALEATSKISQELLKNIINKFNDVASQISALDNKINRHPYSLNKKELEYKLEHLEFSAEKHSKSLEELEKANEKLDIEALKASLESELKEALNENIKVKI